MHEMFKAPTTAAQIFITTVLAVSLLACGKSDSPGGSKNPRQDAALADALGALDAIKIVDGAQASTSHDGAADRATDVLLGIDVPTKADRPQGADLPAMLYDGGSDTGRGSDATDGSDLAFRIDSATGDASAHPETRDSAVSPQHDGSTGPDLAAKTDLAKIPEGTQIQPHRVMHLAASDFPYQTFVNNWDDDKYPVLYALIQSSAEFGTYLHPAATMGSSGFAPTEKEFAENSYFLIVRAVDDSSQPATFAVEALIAGGTELSVLYQFQNAKIPGTSTKKDGLLVEFPKRSWSKVTLYENRTMLGSLDIANGKNDVTVN
jgi:hypothetical protein